MIKNYGFERNFIANLLLEILRNAEKSLLIDFGADHSIIKNNTYLFYNKKLKKLHLITLSI